MNGELQTTPKGERLHIALYGKRNVGKSSLLNAITGQSVAIVSDVAGTTTDPVTKAMEILPLGPCSITDTPGLDDEGELGKERVKKAMQELNRTDIVLLVLDINSLTNEDLRTEHGLPEAERDLLIQMKEKNLPYLIVLNQADRKSPVLADKVKNELQEKNAGCPVIITSAAKGEGIQNLKEALIEKLSEAPKKASLIGDLVKSGDIAVLVVPIDQSAPKGRLILPQQQVIRDILDHHGMGVVTQVAELPSVLENLKGQVKLVITDSQAFKEVSAIVPKDIFLTSFSILFARYKGSLKTLTDGVRALEQLEDGDRILIAEGCTHHRQCEDIGTVKIPRLLKKYTGKEFVLETSSGMSFPEHLTEYAMVIHCGGCTLHEKEMKHRLSLAREQHVPIVNYGIFLAYVNGILERSIHGLSLE